VGDVSLDNASVGDLPVGNLPVGGRAEKGACPNEVKAM
jgi:hypothetical protein